MGTAAYHLAKADYFLRRARAPTTCRPPPGGEASGPQDAASRPPDAIAASGPQDAIAASGPQDAVAALRRAAAHAATALAVSAGLPHSSSRRLAIGIHNAVLTGRFSRSHLKTFRQVNTLAAAQARPDAAPPSPLVLRRLRRRVAAFIKDAAALLDGSARPARLAKRSLRIANAAAAARVAAPAPPTAPAAVPPPAAEYQPRTGP